MPQLRSEKNNNIIFGKSVFSETVPTTVAFTNSPTTSPSVGVTTPSLDIISAFDDEDDTSYVIPTANYFIATVDEDQQKRFDAYLNMMLERQQKLSVKKPVVIYEVHPESGIGNMIRGYFTGLVISSLTHRGLMSKLYYTFSLLVSSHADYATNYFIPPFPNMQFKGHRKTFPSISYSFIIQRF